jgi:nucleoid DNA-binding protein
VAGLSIREARLSADALIDWITESLTAGEAIELRGLGAFTVKAMPAKIDRGSIGKTIPAHGKVVFKPCEKLRQAAWGVVSIHARV